MLPSPNEIITSTTERQQTRVQKFRAGILAFIIIPLFPMTLSQSYFVSLVLSFLTYEYEYTNRKTEIHRYKKRR